MLETDRPILKEFDWSTAFPEPKVSPATFCRVFPFHLMFNRDLTIVQAGCTVTRVIPQVCSGNCKLTDVLLPVSFFGPFFFSFYRRAWHQSFARPFLCTVTCKSATNNPILSISHGYKYINKDYPRIDVLFPRLSQIKRCSNKDRKRDKVEIFFSRWRNLRLFHFRLEETDDRWNSINITWTSRNHHIEVKYPVDFSSLLKLR